MKEKFKKIFWRIFDRIRDLDPQVMLFMIVYFKKGWLFDFLQSSETNFATYLELQKSSTNQPKSEVLLKEASEVFKDNLEQFDRRVISDIYESLNELDGELKEIFDSLLVSIYEVLGSKYHESIQPTELTNLMMSIADPKKGEVIYNPFSGLNSLGVKAPIGVKVISQEINRRTYGLGLLRIIAHEKKNDIKPLNSNSITEWQYSKYDCILSTPPFGLQLNKRNSVHEDHRSLESYLLEKVISNLGDNGRAVVVISNNFLFSRSKKIVYLREKLVKDKLIDSIISFPGGLFRNTGMPFSLLSIKKNNDDVPLFIDAKDFVHTNRKKRESKIDEEKILELYEGRKECNASRNVSVKEIQNNKYQLSIGKYFLENYEGVKLKNLVQPIKKERIAKNEKLKLIKISDLSSSFDENYTFNEEMADGSRNKRHLKLSESALLLSTSFDDLKPTYVEIKDEPIAYINMISAFSINTNLVHPVYLTNKLRKEYITRQVDALKVGGAIRRIRSADLLNVKVQIPPIDQQKEVVKSLEEVSKKLKELRNERNAIVDGQKVEKFKEFGSLKHTTGTARQEILNWSINIEDYLNENSNELDKIQKKFIDLYGISIPDALNEIKSNVEYITKVLEKGEKGLILDKYQKSVVTLFELKKLINGLNYSGFKFDLVKRISIDGEISKRGIKANKDLLKILFENLLTNANKYAFNNLNKESNELVIELTEAKGFLWMEVKDNGKGFKSNYTKEKYATWLSTTSSNNGEGEGGYTVDQIAKYFGDDNWQLILNDDPIYPVKFLFKFKIIAAE
ncbi:MAG: N-6 DNA methylase [Candidatus Paceibacterota bacterium]